MNEVRCDSLNQFFGSVFRSECLKPLNSYCLSDEFRLSGVLFSKTYGKLFTWADCINRHFSSKPINFSVQLSPLMRIRCAKLIASLSREGMNPEVGSLRHTDQSIVLKLLKSTAVTGVLISLLISDDAYSMISF